MRSQEKSHPGETGRYNTATIANFNGNISLKNISPRREGEIKNLPQQREEISRASDGGAQMLFHHPPIAIAMSAARQFPPVGALM